jgi:prepilin-type N-terminal cleavage/methylation domain-containing protein
MQSFAPGRSRRPASARRAAAAFTLLELLIAIAIIGILASLILTVAGSANTKAKNAQVTVDIKDLEKGIAAFKQKFGVEPPSRITIYEIGTGAAPAGTGWAADPRSMGIIRQIWPQFDFNYTAEGGSIDINGDGVFTGDGVTGTSSGAIALTSSECLVFFLGGVPATLYAPSPPNPPNTLICGGAPAGFSTNPADPFNVTLSGTIRTVVGTNRDRFAEFNTSRVFLLKPPLVTTAHTMNSVMDTLPGQQLPYLYLSTYGGQGYDLTNELPAGPAGNQLTDVYRQGAGTSSPTWNPNSYQIISPGFDQLYGIGGEYEQGDSKGLLVGNRSGERDNITNFSSGVLAP